MVCYSAEELLRKTFQDITHPEDLATDLEYVRKLLAGEIRTYQMEKRYFHKLGHVVWVLLSVTLVRDKESRPVHFISQIQDITQRRLVEERLRLQSTALEAAAIGIVLSDSKGTILWVNPAFTKLTGYTATEAIGQKASLQKSGKHDEKFYRNLWQTVNSGNVWQGDIINRRKDGSLYDEELTITPVCDERGEITYFIAMKQDITDRKQAETSLRESEELFRSLSVSSPLGIFLTDAQGRLTYANPRCRELYGFTLMESQNDGWTQFIHAEDRVCHRNDNVLCVHVRAARMQSDSSESMGFVGTIEDVTVRKRSEDDLRESKQRLEQ